MLRLTFTLLCIAVASVRGFLLNPPGGSTLPTLAEPPLRIGSFNIQVFGVTKVSDTHIVNILVQILSRYDIVQILEIRDSTDTVLEKLRVALNHFVSPSGPDVYQKKISGRLGRTNSKEQYGFLYKSAKVTVTGTYQVPDTHDVFEREPYCVGFSSPATTVNNFVLCAIHIQPSMAAEEMDNLTHAYSVIHQHFHTDNIIIGGDFNADCNYLSLKEWKTISLRTDSRFEWLIDDDVDTTVSVSSCSYDRFVITGNELSSAVVPGSVKAYRFDEIMGLPKDQGLKVSDHYPVEMELKGQPHLNVQHSIRSFVSFSIKDVQPVSNVNNIREIYRDPSCADSEFTIKVLKEDTHMDYVEAKFTTEDPLTIMPKLKAFYSACNGTISQELLVMVDGYLAAKFLSSSSPEVYGLVYSIKKHNYDATVQCSLIDPLICEVNIARNVS